MHVAVRVSETKNNFMVKLLFSMFCISYGFVYLNQFIVKKF